ncbi:hypothetical protein [Aquipseudomonas alcaligenes]|uniref:Uncharacterized protein n=1 Tax=Aquipseudomonas alcaligenes TaxID=43263 RepID=A0A1N6WBY7_AQUAC|nr:hypothetical protein [Pseudomonas alcaligenes]SIQ87659.1 hypothetical protein SAMN05878282_109107 [Pseudomonas alcaligenes]
MMEGTGSVNIAAAREQIDELCAKVGFVRTEKLPQPGSTDQVPEEAALWSSSYARVLLWPCRASDSVAVEQAAAAGQAWFDEVLIQGERATRGRPIDGYLVIALPKAPDTGAWEDIRRIELSAQVCRKHLIWPSSAIEIDGVSSRWLRVDDVTVLGLPEAIAAPGPELQWPEMDTEAETLWNELVSIGVSAAILRHEGAV